MYETKAQVVITIIAVIAVLLFIGILFLVLIWSYNNKKQQMERDKRQIQSNFEKQLLQSRLEIQEETFTFISQEIHDNVGQMLSLAKVQLNIAEQKGVFDPGALEEIKDTIGTALTDLRGIARSLSSERIYSVHLSEGIREAVNRLNKSGLHTSLFMQGHEQEIGKQEKLILYRIVQEATQNILKHASATEVKITLDYTADRLMIVIADNGVGFRLDDQLQKHSGLGLQNILNRTTLIGGIANIHSSAETGTAITINLPIWPIKDT